MYIVRVVYHVFLASSLEHLPRKSLLAVQASSALRMHQAKQSGDPRDAAQFTGSKPPTMLQGEFQMSNTKRCILIDKYYAPQASRGSWFLLFALQSPALLELIMMMQFQSLGVPNCQLSRASLACNQSQNKSFACAQFVAVLCFIILSLCAEDIQNRVNRSIDVGNPWFPQENK